MRIECWEFSPQAHVFPVRLNPRAIGAALCPEDGRAAARQQRTGAERPEMMVETLTCGGNSEGRG